MSPVGAIFVPSPLKPGTTLLNILPPLIVERVSQESDFQESGEVDRFLKMGTHFQERSGSLENGLCITRSGFWLRPLVFVWLLILVAVEQIYDQITRRLVAQRIAPAARVILSQTPSFRRWRLLMETMAYWQQVSLSLPRCSYLFVLRRPRTLVPTGPT